MAISRFFTAASPWRRYRLDAAGSDGGFMIFEADAVKPA
jgi:hypothetical protein